MKFFNKKAVSDLGPGPAKPRSFWRRMGRDPHVDWLLSVVASLLVMITFASIGLMKYLSYDQNLKEQVSATKFKETTTIDTKTLDIVLGRYDERARLKEELIRGYSGPKDPSI
jgi:hypothetical protein